MVGSPGAPFIDGIEDLEVIGHGGFAVVYRGYQPAFRRSVAVKVIRSSSLDDTDRDRFDRECQAMGALSDHPGIVTLFDAGFTADGRPYMVMVYVAAGSLQDRLAQGVPLAWPEVARSGVRLAGALEAAHRSGVLHRDVKPGNVLRSPYGDQLTDFGIARIAGGHETVSGVVTASIAHAPPEILDGHPPTRRADVYSLGSTLHHCLTGSKPFGDATGGGIGSLLNRVMTSRPPDLEPLGVPTALAELVATAMEKDPVNRFSTALEMGEALRSAQSSLGEPPTDLIIFKAGGSEGDESKTVARTKQEPAAPPPIKRVEADATAIRRLHETPSALAAIGDGTVVRAEPTTARRASWRALAVAVLVALVVGGVLVWSSTRNNGATIARGSVSEGATRPLGAATTTATRDSGPTTDGSSPPVVLELPPGEPVVLEFLHLGFLEDELKGIVAEFEEVNPAIRVDLRSGGGFTATMEAALQRPAGNQPDVVLAGERAYQAISDGLDIVPVQEMIDRDDFDIASLLPAATDRFSTDNELVAMPFNISTAVVYANVDLLRTIDPGAGDSAAAGTLSNLTVDELFAWCDAIADQVDVCIEFDNNAFLFEQLVANSGGEVFDEDDGRSGQPTSVVFDSDPVSSSVFEFMVEMVTSGRAVERSRQFERTGELSFGSGRALFRMSSASALPFITDEVEQLDAPFLLGAASIPHLTDVDRQGPVASSGGLWLLDSEEERTTIAGWLLIRHLVEPSVQVDLHQATGYVPVRTDLDDNDGLRDYWESMPVARFPYDQLAATVPSPGAIDGRGGRAGPYHAVDGAIIDALRQAQDGEIAAQPALELAASEANRLIAAYNSANPPK